MSWWKGLLAAVAAVLLVTMPGSAHAQTVQVVDDAGDTLERGLDFTKASFRNHDHSIVAVMRFARDRRGEVIFLVRARGHGNVALVASEHRRRGDDRLTLFTRGNDGTVCHGLRSIWDRAAAKVRIRLPSRCVLNGDYGAIRAWGLTEVFHGGSDVDYAPEQPDGDIRFTAWIPRG